MDNSQQVQIILQLVMAVILGGLIGLEREFKKKEAGLQTYSLVTLGACLFTIIAPELFSFFSGKAGISFDPSRIIQAVAIGIGFIGAGVIIYRESRVEGITTAAGLWCSAAIGVAIGIKLYFLALLATLLATIILFVFGELERKFLKKK
jgi:putative Mg2+ transporter-C (MgtC) family protein